MNHYSLPFGKWFDARVPAAAQQAAKSAFTRSFDARRDAQIREPGCGHPNNRVARLRCSGEDAAARDTRWRQAPRAASDFSRIAVSDMVGVKASVAILRWMMAGLPDCTAAA